MHEQFQELLDQLVDRSAEGREGQKPTSGQKSGVGQEVLGEVLARTSLRAPEETSRVEIAAGNLAARRPVDQRAIPQGTVSKAVKALLAEGLLEDGEKLLRNDDGRTLSPLRLGSLWAIAGVKVQQRLGEPTGVTTALVGLDSSRVLGMSHKAVRGGRDSWEQAAGLIRRQIISLKGNCDQDRARAGLPPLQMFGIGVEVGAPVYNGAVLPLSASASQPAVDLTAMLRELFDADPGFDRPVPVVVENDVNALAVLAIHEEHYAESDLVVVSVFDEGIGGGLIMDGRLRRGGNGRAMEIGHLAVGFPPGQEPGTWQENPPANPLKPDEIASGSADPGFGAPCSCGRYGHVDARATPSRIRGELDISDIKLATKLNARDPGFGRAREVLTRSGAALGRALAHVSNTVNPSSLIMYLPAALAEPEPGTAAAAYREAAEAEIIAAFAASDQPGYLTIRPLPAKASEAALIGAKAAAVCVLESFIEHALRLDGCKSAIRRVATGTRPPAAA